MSAVLQDKSFSILIVDDNRRMRESIRDLLAIHGMTTTLAEDGQQALEFLVSSDFDLVLLDIEMPNIDGLQVMSRINELYSDTDVIVLSGKASFVNARRALRSGAHDFLDKPYNPSELIELIHGITNKKQQNTSKAKQISDNGTQDEVEKTLLELEDIIHNDDLAHANEIINASPAVAFMWQNLSTWQVQFVSENVQKLMGYSAHEFISNKVNYKNIIHPDDLQRVMAEVTKESKTGKSKRKPYRIITRSGVVKWVDDCSSPVRDEQGNISHYQGMIIDATERELTKQEMIQNQLSLQHVAHHDSLTGLPNRLLLLDRLQHSIKKTKRSKKRLAVLYIDLDKFKPINDMLGHAAGDKVLVTVAQRLTHCVRAVDTVARIGGDEFIVLMESVADLQDVKVMANKLNQSLQQSIHWFAQELFVTSSIGISISPDDAVNSDELMKKADIAMYQSKEDGRNTVHFYNAL